MLCIRKTEVSVPLLLATLRLAAKCANSFNIARRSNEFKPIQVSVGVSGGAEAIVHATRRIVSELPIRHVMVKLEFANAFNSARRDAILDKVADKLPELYKFVYASHACDSKLTFGTSTILSCGGSQQGDPLIGLEFCETVQPLLESAMADAEFAYLDDFSLGGEVNIVAADVENNMKTDVNTGLQLNPTMCKISA